MASVKIGWGKRQDGLLIHVKEAERGKGCNCCCPDCGTPLIARQGAVTAWHFAHAQPVECYGESVLHKAAKQIISHAVGSEKKLSLPSQKKVITVPDLAGNAFTSNWVFPEKKIKIDGAQEEFRFANGQISDVLLTSCDHESDIAVEIFVTHKKSDLDIQKFSEIKQDVIEIDLSYIDALADKETLEELVLQKSERYWLFNLEESKQQEYIEQKAEKRNQDYCDEMLAIVKPAIELGQLDSLDFSWPELTKTVSREGKLNEMAYGEATRIPKVTKLNASDSFTLIQYGCVTDALVENRTKVNVCFTMLGIDLPTLDKNIPLLVLEYDPSEKQFLVSWLYIQKWKKRLTELAEENLAIKLEEQKSQHYNQISYAKNFSAKSDLEKIKFLANELSLTPPHDAGQYLEHWNTTWHIWKTLVWKYKILRKQGDLIDVEHISMDDWFEQLLNWPQDEGSQEWRSKNIWRFLKELEKAGIVKHYSHLFFTVSTSLPENFIPWLKR